MRRTIPDKVPVQQLIRHMEKHFSDYHINNHMWSIYSACRSKKAESLARRYATVRRKCPSFKPGEAKPHKSNHKLIDKKELNSINRKARRIDRLDDEQSYKICRVCGQRWQPKRRDAEICRPACQQRGVRARARLLEAECPHGKTLADCQKLWCASRREDLPKAVGPIPEGV